MNDSVLWTGSCMTYLTLTHLKAEVQSDRHFKAVNVITLLHLRRCLSGTFSFCTSLQDVERCDEHKVTPPPPTHTHTRPHTKSPQLRAKSNLSETDIQWVKLIFSASNEPCSELSIFFTALALPLPHKCIPLPSGLYLQLHHTSGTNSHSSAEYVPL